MVSTLGRIFSSSLLRTFISVVNHMLLLVVTSEVTPRKPLSSKHPLRHVQYYASVSVSETHYTEDKISTCMILVLKNTG